MKFGVVILFVLGIIAAACAAVLMGIFNTNIGTIASGSTPLGVAIVNASLPAMTIIKQDDISTEDVSKDELPKGKLANPKSVIGRVLAMPVYEGQILTESCFVPEDSATQLLAMIPNGMRMVTVPVSSKSMPERAFLRPGCIVDVVAVYRLSGQDSVSNTMLRGIQVLAVDGETVLSYNEEKDEDKSKRSNRDSSVTLLVDTKQAEGLVLAVQNGIISLSVRNPLDKNNDFETDGTTLNKNRLGELGEAMDPTLLNKDNESNLIIDTPNQPDQGAASNNPQSQGTDTAATGTVVPQQPKKQTIKQRKKVTWPVEVIRGQQSNVKEYDATEAESGKITPKK
jgi:Flp pilus assembly protein CpaB